MIFSHGLHGFSRIEWSGKIDNLGSECHNVYMSTAVRYTPQKKQELRSRHQLADRLTEFGWVPVVPEDLGEDFIVHIYHEGRATGVNFFVQLKSVTNLNGRRKGDFLPYSSFEVKDLLHWEQFTLPVVLIVWDVKLREGRWALVEDVIKQLDKDNSSWRQQKTKTVQIPWQNNFLEVSLVSLRHRIGEIFFPQIFKDKSFEFNGKVIFPNSEEGKKELQAFENAIKDGDPGSWNAQLEIPKELVPWLGGPKINNAKLFREPLTSGKRYSANIVAYDLANHATSLSIELQVVKIGAESATLSNYHQGSFLQFLLVFKPENSTSEFKISVNQHAEYFGQNSLESRNIFRFLRALAIKGLVRVEFHTEKNYSFTAEVSNLSKLPYLPSKELITLLDKLCVIENKFFSPIKVSVNGFTNQESQDIHELFEIIQYGKNIFENRDITISLEIMDSFKTMFEAYKKNNEETIRLKIARSDISYELFENKFRLGKMIEFITGKPIFPEESVLAASKPGDIFLLKLQKSTVHRIFPDIFLQEAQRISHLLFSEFNLHSIYLFGSLAWGEMFSPETDIDLAVSGLKSELLYKAIGFLEGETNFPFDLIDLDEASPTLRERILREGELLYERELVAVGG